MCLVGEYVREINYQMSATVLFKILHANLQACIVQRLASTRDATGQGNDFQCSNDPLQGMER